jgi:hypothetical protein
MQTSVSDQSKGKGLTFAAIIDSHGFEASAAACLGVVNLFAALRTK